MGEITGNETARRAVAETQHIRHHMLHYNIVINDCYHFFNDCARMHISVRNPRTFDVENNIMPFVVVINYFAEQQYNIIFLLYYGVAAVDINVAKVSSLHVASPAPCVPQTIRRNTQYS